MNDLCRVELLVRFRWYCCSRARLSGKPENWRNPTQSKALRRILNRLTCLLCLQFNWAGIRIILARFTRVRFSSADRRSAAQPSRCLRAQVAAGIQPRFQGPFVGAGYALVTRLSLFPYTVGTQSTTPYQDPGSGTRYNVRTQSTISGPWTMEDLTATARCSEWANIENVDTEGTA